MSILTLDAGFFLFLLCKAEVNFSGKFQITAYFQIGLFFYIINSAFVQSIGCCASLIGCSLSYCFFGPFSIEGETYNE